MKKIQFALSIAILFIAAQVFSQNEVERALSNFSGLSISQNVEAELLKGSSNKVVLTFTGVKEKLVVSEITDGKLVIGYKGDKKPDGATLKAKVYASEPIGSLELASSSTLKVSGVSWAKSLFLKVSQASVAQLDPTTTSLDCRVNGKSQLTMKAKIETGVLSISSSGKAQIQMEAKKSLEAKVASKGKLEITGNTESLKVVANNSAKYMGYDMKSKNLTVQAHSSGWAEVYASESIVVNVVSEGKVFYKGSPGTTDFNGTSSGKIEKAD